MTSYILGTAITIIPYLYIFYLRKKIALLKAENAVLSNSNVILNETIKVFESNKNITTNDVINSMQNDKF